jgi:type IV secretory pathway TraG/TraD family ATPase VirD4
LNDAVERRLSSFKHWNDTLLCSCHWTWLCIQSLRTCWWCSHSFTTTYFQRSWWIFFMIMYLHKILIAKSIIKPTTEAATEINLEWLSQKIQCCFQ